MSLSLGEKLRSAREERGISISEVAEQTRISPLYLEAIDADNYKSLPGGIFNKGFVRSYAKHVGIDEQEALQDYSRQIEQSAPVEDSEFKTYRPEVLTDDRSATSIVPTVIFAAVILGLMTAGILFLVNYIQNQQSEPPIAANTTNISNQSSAANAAPETAPIQTAGSAPAMGAVKVEFRTMSSEIWLSAVSDGTKSSAVVTQDKPAVFEPKEKLTLSYSKSLAKVAQLLINGKAIALPATPLTPKKGVIELDLSRDNLPTVWQNASFTGEPASTPTAEANTAVNSAPPAAAAPKASPKPSSTPKPASTNSNAAAPTGPPTMTGKPPAKPAATPKPDKPPANTEKAN